MPVTLPWLQEGSVRVHGMLMSTLDIFNSSSYLRDLLVTNTGLEWKKQHNTTHNLLVGFRSFSEEKRSEWSTHISYYGKALKNLQRPNQAIHIFGDEGVHDFAKLIASMLVYNQQVRMLLYGFQPILYANEN
jgi:hypothetical protein